MKRPGAPTPSVAAARAELEAARRCFDLPLRGEDAGRTQQAYTTRIDAFVREAATSTRIEGCPPFALVALGGYGREEMAPFSDIDLLFLTGTEWEARWLPFPEALHRRLWDLGLPVGFSIRSIETALADAREDLVFQTALLDRRFVGGDPERFEAFDARLRVEVHAPQIEAFVAAKLAEQERRRTRYGDSVYILEPNVRDGAGGLRDYHLLRWLATLFFPRLPFEELPSAGKMAPESFQALTRAVAFLWKVRHHLHRHFRRKNDHLRFEAQERIADRLGFRETKSALAVEHFMRTFYLHARTVERETGRWIETWLDGHSPAPPAGNRRERKQLAEGFVIMEGRLTLEDDRLLRESPERLVTLFREMARSDVTLHPTLKGMIRAHRFRLDSGVQCHPAAREAFFEILRSPRAFRVLEEMHDLGILVRWIPEFRKVVCKMQHDLYHVYTVDRHLLFTVKHLLSLLPGGGDEWGSFVRWTPEMETMRPVLLLAGLLHDIGKGDGPGHASRGATIVRTIGERLGMSPEAIDLLVFLVSEHLRMAHISQRRDLNDPDLIADFARSVRSQRNLTFLTLLTAADMRSVGPGVFTDWKGRLLRELYERTAQWIAQPRGIPSPLAAAAARRREVFERLTATGVHPPAEIRAFLDSLSDRYFLLNEPESVIDHFTILSEMGEKAVRLRHTGRGEDEIVVHTRNHPGRLALITGLMAACGLHIRSAQINTREDGTILDLFQLQPHDHLDLAFARFRERIEPVLAGTLDVERLLEKRRATYPEKRPPLASRLKKNEVVVDNETSRIFTVIEVIAQDRTGLLYTITQALAELGLDIHLAKIATEVDQAVDVFYVREVTGKKVSGPQREGEIRQHLLAALASEEGGIKTKERP